MGRAWIDRDFRDDCPDHPLAEACCDCPAEDHSHPTAPWVSDLLARGSVQALSDALCRDYYTREGDARSLEHAGWTPEIVTLAEREAILKRLEELEPR